MAEQIDLAAEWFPRAKSELTVCEMANGEFAIACPIKPLTETEACSSNALLGAAQAVRKPGPVTFDMMSPDLTTPLTLLGR